MMMSMVPQLRLNTCLATVWVYEPRVPASLAGGPGGPGFPLIYMEPLFYTAPR